MSFFKRLFSKKNEDWTDEELDNFYMDKDEALERALGKQTPTVGHAIIGFEIGGAFDMYYYHHKSGGTILATQEYLDSKQYKLKQELKTLGKHRVTQKMIAHTMIEYLNVEDFEIDYNRFMTLMYIEDMNSKSK